MLFESKPHIITIFHLKTNKKKPEKYHVNGSQTRRVNTYGSLLRMMDTSP